MWSCVCGRAFYSALPPDCPTCGRAVDADDEETVTIDGRKLPFHVWEAEVLVRAAGWASLLRGGGLILGSLFEAPFSPGVAGLVGVVGLYLSITGLATFRRSWVSRWALVAQFVVMPTLFCIGALAGRTKPNSASADLALIGMAAEVVVLILTLYVTASQSADWVWEMAPRQEPLAPLSSAWSLNRSLKAWASVGMVCLAGLAAVVFALLVSGSVFP